MARIESGLVVPEARPGFALAPGEAVFALGPCLSRGLEGPLAAAGLAVTSRDPEIAGLADPGARSLLAHDTPEALAQELRWAAGAPFPEAALVETRTGALADPLLGPRAPGGTAEALLARRAGIAAYFRAALAADLALVTLGQTEGLRDAATGLMLAGPLPEGPDVTGRFAPEALTLEACEAALEAMVALRAAHGPAGGRMILAVSPVPMLRTALGGDVIAASLEAKATLRVAAGRVAARHAHVDYFPFWEAAVSSDPAQAWRPDRRRVSGPLMGRAAQALQARYLPAAVPPGRAGAAADPRARRIARDLVERRAEVQIRPYDRRDWGGPDAAVMPAHGRLHSRAQPIDRFPKIWSQEREGLPRRAGTYLWGGPLKVHFGHLMVDSVARLWAFDRGIHDGVVFARRGGGQVPDWLYRVLGQYGLRRGDVVLVEAPEIFEAVDFAPPGSTLGLGPTPAYLDWLGARPRPRRRLGGARFGEKLYVGRLHMAHKGTLMGESYFAERLLAAGFEHFYPERHAIQDQVRALREAREVVFLEGSGVYAVELLQSSAARFHMIARRRIGAELFEPHIAPRAAAFGLLGAPGTLTRFTTVHGGAGPSGPSRTRRPETILADMVAAGLVPEQPFDPEAFRAAAHRDAAAHARGDAARTAEVVAWLDEAWDGSGDGPVDGPGDGDA